MSEHITFREETRKAAIWSGWITFGLDFLFVCLFLDFTLCTLIEYLLPLVLRCSTLYTEKQCSLVYQKYEINRKPWLKTGAFFM